MQTYRICPICRTSLLSEETVETCSHCQTQYHFECWKENGGCGTYGCEMAPVIERDDNEQVNRIYPGFTQIEEDGFSENSYTAKEINRTAVKMFLFAILGLTAPLVLIFGGIWYRQNKQKLQEISPFHNLLAVIGLAISGFYSFLILLSLLLG